MASISGTSGKDVLSGTADDDLIEGLAGDDTLYGDAGNVVQGDPWASVSTTRISIATDGVQANGYSRNPSLSADGGTVAFVSEAPNLVAGDTNADWDVFVRDLHTGAVTRVSTAANGTQANGCSENPSLSADGRYVAFVSEASNLVPGDTNRTQDVFVKDLHTGITTLVSAAASGVQGNGYSESPSLAADTRRVAFDSDASNLVAGDTNDNRDVYVKDLTTGAVTRASTASDGTQGNDSSFAPSVSAAGRYVAFESIATNLVTADTNSTTDVFVKDLQTGTITRASTAADGTEADDWSGLASIAAGGRYVAFASWASNLVPGDTNYVWDVFVKDLETGAITRASTAADGSQADGWSYACALSADGRLVAFDSDASNLVAGDTNGARDTFVKDLHTGAITRVSAVSDGTQGYDSSGMPSISADGRQVAFASWATNLVPEDTNASADIFLAGGAEGSRLSIRGGDDRLYGGEGFDTAVFSGPVASYRFAESGAQITVSGPGGTDTLTGIEQLTFGNLTFSIADRSHFDPLVYLNRNPDVAAAAIDPLTHYRIAGWAEGRDPNASVHLSAVDGLEYIASYGDLIGTFGANKAMGYQHFATQGVFEDRTSSFDGLEYIASYGDLIDAFHSQIAATGSSDIGAIHYIVAGCAEQRAPDVFDAHQYLANYGDLQLAFGSDTEAATLHYITAGYFEGRTDGQLL